MAVWKIQAAEILRAEKLTASQIRDVLGLPGITLRRICDAIATAELKSATITNRPGFVKWACENYGEEFQPDPRLDQADKRRKNSQRSELIELRERRVADEEARRARQEIDAARAVVAALDDATLSKHLAAVMHDQPEAMRVILRKSNPRTNPMLVVEIAKRVKRAAPVKERPDH